jgi:hypothetical protein
MGFFQFDPLITKMSLFLFPLSLLVSSLSPLVPRLSPYVSSVSFVSPFVSRRQFVYWRHIRTVTLNSINSYTVACLLYVSTSAYQSGYV